jgi:hypothetical protein
MLLSTAVVATYSHPRGIDVARRHGGNWSFKSATAADTAETTAAAAAAELLRQRGQEEGTVHSTRGPLLGNADLSAVLEVDKSGSVFSWYVTKTDAWSSTDIFGMGIISIGVAALNGSATTGHIHQDLGTATTFISANSSASTVAVETFVTAPSNIMVTEINITSASATVVNISNSVYAGVAFQVDSKTHRATGPERTLANCTAFGRNGVKRGGRAGFAESVGDSMVGMLICCANRTKEATRLALATRVLPVDATATSIGYPLCGPVQDKAGVLNRCTTTVHLSAGTTTLRVLTSAVSNINMAGDRTPGPPTTVGNVDELRNATLALLTSATPTTVATLRHEHGKWWSTFWNASAISFPSRPTWEGAKSLVGRACRTCLT